MTMGFLKRCAAGGPQLSKSDQLMGSAAMLVFSLLFAGLYVLAAYLYRGNELVDALGIMTFPGALVAAMPFTYLKGHSTLSKTVIVGGLLLGLAAISYVASLI